MSTSKKNGTSVAELLGARAAAARAPEGLAASRTALVEGLGSRVYRFRVDDSEVHGLGLQDL